MGVLGRDLKEDNEVNNFAVPPKCQFCAIRKGFRGEAHEEKRDAEGIRAAGRRERSVRQAQEYNGHSRRGAGREHRRWLIQSKALINIWITVSGYV